MTTLDQINRLEATGPSPSRFSAPSVRPQKEFDFDWSGLPHAFALLTVREAAAELGCSDQHIRNFIDELKLLAFNINVDENPQRADLRIVRSTLSTAELFRPREARLRDALDKIRSVDAWLFTPCREDLDWLPCLKKIGARSVLTIDETAKALRCAGKHVRSLHAANHFQSLDLKSDAATLRTLRIARASLVAFVQSRLCLQNNLPTP